MAEEQSDVSLADILAGAAEEPPAGEPQSGQRAAVHYLHAARLRGPFADPGDDLQDLIFDAPGG